MARSGDEVKGPAAAREALAGISRLQEGCQVKLLRWVSALICLAALPACVTSETRPQPLSAAHKAETEVAEPQLLDVGIALFDPNVPATEKEQKAQRVDSDVRSAEARYMPVLLANTMQGTGYWGQV